MTIATEATNELAALATERDERIRKLNQTAHRFAYECATLEELLYNSAAYGTTEWCKKANGITNQAQLLRIAAELAPCDEESSILLAAAIIADIARMAEERIRQ